VENFIDQELQECLDARISTWKDKNYNTSWWWCDQQFLNDAPQRGGVSEALFWSVYLPMCRCVDLYRFYI
jgi:hypothetical protein